LFLCPGSYLKNSAIVFELKFQLKSNKEDGHDRPGRGTGDWGLGKSGAMEMGNPMGMVMATVSVWQVDSVQG